MTHAAVRWEVVSRPKPWGTHETHVAYMGKVQVATIHQIKKGWWVDITLPEPHTYSHQVTKVETGRLIVHRHLDQFWVDLTHSEPTSFFGNPCGEIPLPQGYRRTIPEDGFAEDGLVPIERYGSVVSEPGFVDMSAIRSYGKPIGDGKTEDANAIMKRLNDLANKVIK